MEIATHIVVWMGFVCVVGFFVTGAMKKFPRATPFVIIAGTAAVIGYAAWLFLR